MEEYSALARIYADLIKKGLKDINDVRPESLRELVQKILDLGLKQIQ